MFIIYYYMIDNKDNIKKLDPSTRQDLISKLEANYEILDLQARVAEARARIQKAKLEEIAYALKLQEFEEGKKDPQPSPTLTRVPTSEKSNPNGQS